jgi:hypothetical protein
VFAVFYNTDHDYGVLSPLGALAAIKRIRCSPRGELSPGGIERRSVPQDIIHRDGCAWPFCVWQKALPHIAILDNHLYRKFAHKSAVRKGA